MAPIVWRRPFLRIYLIARKVDTFSFKVNLILFDSCRFLVSRTNWNGSLSLGTLSSVSWNYITSNEYFIIAIVIVISHDEARIYFYFTIFLALYRSSFLFNSLTTLINLLFLWLLYFLMMLLLSFIDKSFYLFLWVLFFCTTLLLHFFDKSFLLTIFVSFYNVINVSF